MGNEFPKAFLEDFVGVDVEFLFLLGEWTLELKWQGSYHHYHQPGTTFIHEIKVTNSIGSTHRPGRPLRINFMSRYICFSKIGPFDVSFEELFSKAKDPGGFFRKKTFFRVHFWLFFCNFRLYESL